MRSWPRRCTRSGSRGSKGRRKGTSSSTPELDVLDSCGLCGFEDTYDRVRDCCLLSEPTPTHLAQAGRRDTAPLDSL